MSSHEVQYRVGWLKDREDRTSVILNSFTLARVLESYIKGREHIGLNCPSNALASSRRLDETIAQTNNLTLSFYYMLPAS